MGGTRGAMGRSRFAALSAALATEMRADWGIVDMQAENDFCPV